MTTVRNFSDSRAAALPRRTLGRSNAFYCTARWRKLRHLVLAHAPLCVDPHGTHARNGERTVAAVDVDHKIPVKRAPELAYEWRNLQGLCRSCHSRKTARGD